MTENDAKINWMYQGPGGHVSREEYLLGRKVDASLDLLNRAENNEPEPPPKSSHVIEYEILPDSIARRRAEDLDPSAPIIQVDMKRKLLEDPLLMIRKKEEMTRLEITNNPVKRKQLEILIKKIREESSSDSDSSSGLETKKRRKSKKNKSKISKKVKKHKTKKKYSKDKSKRKQKITSKKKRRPRSSSSSSSTSSSQDSEDGKKRQSTKSYTSSKSNVFSDDYSRAHNGMRRHLEQCEDGLQHRKDDRNASQNRYFYNHRSCTNEERHSRKRNRSPESSGKKQLGRSPKHYRESDANRQRNLYEGRDRTCGNKLTNEEMEERRLLMMKSAVSRDEQRKQNVERHQKEQQQELNTEHKAENIYLQKHMTSASNAHSIEQRIKSRSGTRQSGFDAMNQNFARK